MPQKTATIEKIYGLNTIEFRIKFPSDDEKNCILQAIHELINMLYNFKSFGEANNLEDMNENFTKIG